MNKQPDKLETLFHAALALPPEKREAYLDAACEDNAPLRKQIQMLLAGATEADPFFQKDALQLAGVNWAQGDERIGPSLAEAPGSVIGRYKLLEKIGEGGFGAVYVAEQKEPVKRRVALKIIKLGMDTRQVIARFEAERQALALMDHPNIAKVLDAGATDTGRPYFVMELVRGIPITRYCDENKVGTEQRLDLFMQVCHAIQHAHQKGIIHRDIKPSNILVTVNDGVPVPKVIDFGIAKATQGELTDKTIYTQFEQFIGTPAYTSPEQADMTSLDIDTRSDIYALGVLLYELLVGRTPFDGKELLLSGLDEMRRTIREKEPVRPSTRLNSLVGEERTTTAKRRSADPSKLAALLRGDLDWIVMKCLEKDRTRRYETANGLAADLKRFLNIEPVTARPPSAAYRFRKAFRRNQLMFVASGVVVSTLILGVVISTWQAVRARRAERQAATQAETARQSEKKAIEKSALAEEQRQIALTNEFPARQNLYVAEMHIAQQAIDAGNLGQALALLNRHRPKQPGDVDFRGWEWRHLWFKTRGTEKLKRHFDMPRGGTIAATSDGRLLASGVDAHHCRVWDVTSGTELASFDAGQSEFRGSASKDNLILAWDDRNVVTGWDITTKQRLFTSPPLTNEFEFTFFSASQNGKRLFANGIGGPSVWDLPSLRQRTIPELLRRTVVRGISDDGRLLLLLEAVTGTLTLLDIDTGESSTYESSARSRSFGVAFSTDQTWFTTGELDGRIAIWKRGEKQTSTSWQAHNSMINYLRVSPDGQRLASAGDDGLIRVWEVGSWAKIKELRGHAGSVLKIDFNADGKQLLSLGVDGTTRVWELSSPDVEEIIWSDSSPVGSAAFSPDGRLLAIGSFAALRVFDSSNWRQIKSVEAKVGDFTATTPQFALDKQTLFTAGPRGIAFWNYQTDTLRYLPAPTGRITGGAALAPDGQSIAVPMSDRTVRLWNAESGQETTSLPSNGAGALSVRFAPDGRTLFVGDEAGRLTAWDLQSRRQLYVEHLADSFLFLKRFRPLATI